MATKLSIITVTYNSQQCIQSYLDSVLKHLPPSSEVIIVDNLSQDATAQIVKQERSVKLVENKKNLGFSKGNNIGAKVALGEYLFFLNPDIHVVDDSTNKLLEFAQSHPEAGLVAPRLIEPGGSTQASVKKLPTLLGVIREYWLGQRYAYEQYAPTTGQPIEVEAVYGAAMMIKKELLEKIGGFDERYFLFFEDLDLCRKIGKLGLKIIYYPRATFKHLVGASMSVGEQLPVGLRTLAWFFPNKRSGSRYYQIISENIYHGVLKALLIRLLTWLSIKLGRR